MPRNRGARSRRQAVAVHTGIRETHSIAGGSCYSIALTSGVSVAAATTRVRHMRPAVTFRAFRTIGSPRRRSSARASLPKEIES